MKKITLALILLSLTSNTVFSLNIDKEVELSEAPKQYLMSMLRICKDYAEEFEVPQKEFNKYLLSCINDELANGDYKPIKALPKRPIQKQED